jgi:hypothetical protein
MACDAKEHLSMSTRPMSPLDAAWYHTPEHCIAAAGHDTARTDIGDAHLHLLHVEQPDSGKRRATHADLLAPDQAAVRQRD